MAETTFEVVFGGDALAEHRIPVRDLAPSLFALGEVFTEVNKIVNPDDFEITLEIEATSESSFAAHMVLSSLGHDAEKLFSGDAANALVNLKDLVIGPAMYGLFWFIGWRRGRKITNATPPTPSGNVTVTLDDGVTVEIPAQLLDAHQNLKVRKAAREVVAPLDRPGIDSISFTNEKELTIELGDDDRQSFTFAVEDVPEELLRDSIERETLVIETIPLTHPESRWRFSDGDRSFRADIEDANFAERVLRRRENFVSGDLLDCELRRRQFMTATGRLRNEFTIVRVVDHIQAASIGPVVTQPELVAVDEPSTYDLPDVDEAVDEEPDEDEPPRALPPAAS